MFVEECNDKVMVSLLSESDPAEAKNFSFLLENSGEVHGVRLIYLAYVAVS
jgi:hypothetical protein